MTNNDNTTKISDLLHEAGETHHIVFRITDGADDDWASWYSDWLTNHSELPDLLGSVSIAALMATTLARRNFFTPAHQLREPPEP